MRSLPLVALLLPIDRLVLSGLLVRAPGFPPEKIAPLQWGASAPRRMAFKKVVDASQRASAERLETCPHCNEKRPVVAPSDSQARTGHTARMKTRDALAGLLLLSFVFGGSSAAPLPPKAAGGSTKKEKNSTPKRILLVGDSQSVGPVSPGAKLAALVGANVIAKGGKTAAYFVSGDGRAALNEALKSPRAWVVVFLGSNELANIAAFPEKSGELSNARAVAQAKQHTKLKSIIEAAGARALFVGPPSFGAKVTSASGGQPLNNAAPLLVPLLKDVYGNQFIDARAYTPEHKGVHFDKGSAEAFAANLAPVVKGFTE